MLIILKNKQVHHAPKCVKPCETSTVLTYLFFRNSVTFRNTIAQKR